MDLVEELAGLLASGSPQAAADRLYLPHSSTRPSRQHSPLRDFSAGVSGCSRLPAPFDALTRAFLQAAAQWTRICAAPSVAGLEPVLAQCRDLFTGAMEHFGQETTTVGDGEWILRAATSNYIFIGLLLSRAAELEGGSEDSIGDVFHSLKKCLAPMSKKDELKRPMLIFLFAECFRLMFRLKRLGMFPSILTSCQMLGAERLLGRARKSDAVQFLFYRALYAFHAQKIDEARVQFEEAWLLLHPQDQTHRRRVAGYLIAIALTRGRAPTDAFMRKYQLEDAFGNLGGALRRGDVRGFDVALEAQSQRLSQLHVYVFLMLNGHPAVHLSLVKRTWRLAGRGRLVPFAHIVKVAAAQNTPLSSDELECILISLIGKGWIKGHLGHDTQTLMLSSVDPFPRSAQ